MPRAACCCSTWREREGGGGGGGRSRGGTEREVSDEGLSWKVEGDQLTEKCVCVLVVCGWAWAHLRTALTRNGPRP